MVSKQLPLPGEIVKKSNALCRARWTVESIWEPRLVALLASKIRKNDKDFQIYEIPVAEVMPSRHPGGKEYREVENVIEKVMSRVLTIRDEVGQGWTKYNVFCRCRYRPKDGMLELGFHPDLKSHYLDLQRNFAEYGLMEYLLLPSIYSQRLYEILKSWDDQSGTTIPLAELHEMLDVPESLRQDFAQFRRRVLEKAHKDITAITSLEYIWEPIKQGRAVLSIRFLFKDGKYPTRISAKKREREHLKKIKEQSQKNNATVKALIACRAQNGIDDSSPRCPEESAHTAKCKLCIKWRTSTPLFDS